MWEDSDPRQELWDLAGEEEEEEEDADRPPSGGSGESAMKSPHSEGGGCQAATPPGLWAHQGHCWPLAPWPFPGDGPAQGDAGVRSCCEVVTFPWGEEGGPAWAHPLSCWVPDAGAPARRHWCPTEQAVSGVSRTLSHPSFQSFFTAAASSVGGHVSPSESESSVGRLPLTDCSSFYYSDPTMPPGCRIYNRLSGSSQEACRSLPLSTPTPIMSVREASPPRRPPAGSRGLSALELQALSALLELPEGPPQDSCACHSPPPCQEQWGTGADRPLQ